MSKNYIDVQIEDENSFIEIQRPVTTKAKTPLFPTENKCYKHRRIGNMGFESWEEIPRCP